MLDKGDFMMLQCYRLNSYEGGTTMPVIRIDEEVMSELKKRAIDFGLVFEPPNATLRRLLGLGESPVTTAVSKRRLFGTKHTATPVKDTATGQVYLSKYKAGLAFKNEFPDVDEKYVWYQLIHKYPGRFVEVDTGKTL